MQESFHEDHKEDADVFEQVTASNIKTSETKGDFKFPFDLNNLFSM